MTFLIVDTFTDSLARLTGDEHNTVMTTAFDPSAQSVGSALQLHRLDKAKDKRAASAGDLL